MFLSTSVKSMWKMRGYTTTLERCTMTPHVSQQRILLVLVIISLYICQVSSIDAGNYTTNNEIKQQQLELNYSNATAVPSRKEDYKQTQTTKMDDPIRVLYIMTTLREFNTGRRATTRGSDRLTQTVIPVLRESVQSMVKDPFNYHVDVYLVLGFPLNLKRVKEIKSVLPPQTNLRLWNDAAQYAYDIGGREKFQTQLTAIDRLLARQHRFIIRDELLNYDMFVVFEDDMIIKGDHVHHYMEMSTEIFRLRDRARRMEQDTSNSKSENPTNGAFYGEMTAAQLSRTIPGFIRVEALLNEKKFKTQDELSSVPVDLMFPTISNHDAMNNSKSNNTTIGVKKMADVKKTVNPDICCHVNSTDLFEKESVPLRPTSDQLFMWETTIDALGVREMPLNSSLLSWVMLQRGPSAWMAGKNADYGDYWAGKVSKSKDMILRRPHTLDPKYINNQGGWMATQQQLIEWDAEQCIGSFLPPFDQPTYQFDGLDRRNVEYYSGGLQLVQTKNSCGLQRIISLDPDKFSKHLLYHSSNNKQRSHQNKRQRFVRINHLLGQLNAARKHATQAKAKEIENKKTPKKTWTIF